MKENLKKHALYLGVAIVFILVLTLTGVGCPILYFLHVPCPACGSTRAFLSLLRFDFRGYFEYHALSVPLLLSVWGLIHTEIFERKKLVLALSVSVLILNLVYYFFRMI